MLAVVALALALTTPLAALPASSTCSPAGTDVAACEQDPHADGGSRGPAIARRGRPARTRARSSNDGGATWQQSKVPVSSDLTAVYFVNDRKGWAVGHDGVILATSDGGAPWTLQLDGVRANEAGCARRASLARKPTVTQGAARGSEPQHRAGRRQAVPRRVVRGREDGLRGRRVQPRLSNERRRHHVVAVVRPYRQSEIPQPVRDPSRGAAVCSSSAKAASC